MNAVGRPRKPRITLCCEWCNIDFVPRDRAQALGCRQEPRAPKFCSRTCYGASRRHVRKPVPCVICGKESLVLPTLATQRRFCSHKCAQAAPERRVSLAIRNSAKKLRADELQSRKRARWRRDGAKRKASYRLQAELFDPVEIFERDKWVCGICELPVESALKWPHPLSASLDHIVALSLGGPHTRANTRLAHLRCNSKLGARGKACA